MDILIGSRTNPIGVLLCCVCVGLLPLSAQAQHDDGIKRIGNELKASSSGVDVPGAIFLINDKILETGIVFAFSAYFRTDKVMRFQLWRPVTTTQDDTRFQLLAEYRVTPSVSGAREDIYIEGLLDMCTRVERGDKLGIFIEATPSAVPYVFDPSEPRALGYTIEDLSQPTQAGDELTFNSLVFPYDFSVAAYVFLNDSVVSVGTLPDLSTPTLAPITSPNSLTGSPPGSTAVYERTGIRETCPPDLLIPARFSGTLPPTQPTLPPTGAPGPPGPMGTRGAQGPAGGLGATGDQGPSGPEGQIGPVGATGVQGPSGISGPSGGIGATGMRGQSGSGGATGFVGPRGPAGDPGPPGARGNDGKDGTSKNSTNAAAPVTQVAGEFTLLELILIIWLAVVTLVLLIVLIVLCCYCCRNDKEKDKEAAYKRYMSENPYDDPLSKHKSTSLYGATKEELVANRGPNGGATFETTNGGGSRGGQDSTPATPGAYSNTGFSSGTGFDVPAGGGATSPFGPGDDWKQSLREDTFTEVAVDTIDRDRTTGRKTTKSSSSSNYLGY